MSTEENKAIVRRWYEEGFNAHNVAIMDELFTPDFAEHIPGQANRGLAGSKEFLAGTFAAMPDMRLTIEDMIAEGEKVVARFTATGTPQGAFMGVPPTGKAVNTSTIEIIRLEQGKIAEHWVETDMLGLMQQLGVIPAPGQAPR